MSHEHEHDEASIEEQIEAATPIPDFDPVQLAASKAILEHERYNCDVFEPSATSTEDENRVYCDNCRRVLLRWGA